MIFTILNDQNHHLRFYLGRYLHQKRVAKNLSLADLAEKAQLSEKVYRAIESGKSKISFEAFDTLSPILELDLVELSEIYKISQIAFANSITKELSQNYPQ